MILVSTRLGRSTRARLARLHAYGWTLEGILTRFYPDYITLAYILLNSPTWPCYFESFGAQPIRRRIRLSEILHPRRQRRKNLRGWVGAKELSGASSHFELHITDEPLEALLKTGTSKEDAMRILRNGIHFCILTAELLEGDECVLTVYDGVLRMTTPLASLNE